jgi:hypothetical protein
VKSPTLPGADGVDLVLAGAVAPNVPIMRPVVAFVSTALRYFHHFWNIFAFPQVRCLTSKGIDIGLQWRRTLSRQSLGECPKGCEPREPPLHRAVGQAFSLPKLFGLSGLKAWPTQGEVGSLRNEGPAASSSSIKANQSQGWGAKPRAGHEFGR